MTHQRRMALAAAALVCRLLEPSLAHAQGTTTAEGFVLTPEGEPVPDVRVLLQYKGHMPQKYRTRTDKKGRFVHVNVFSGLYDISFTREGQGEVTVRDFTIRDIGPTEKAPTFRLAGARKAAEPAAGATPGAGASSAPAAPTVVELQKANQALAAGRIDEAIAAYDAVLAQVPELAEGHLALGFALSKKGDLARAELELRKAAELKPGLAEAHGELSVLLSQAGRSADAVAEAVKAAELAPRNARWALNLGILYRDTGRGAEAAEALARAEALDPANAETQFYLATALLGRGDIPGASARLERYLAMAPGGPNAAAAQGMLAALKTK